MRKQIVEQRYTIKELSLSSYLILLIKLTTLQTSKNVSR